MDEQYRKNLSRAFGAFALHRICDINPTSAAKSVVDDFDDCGVDAVYYLARTETLYLIQSKIKMSEQFQLADALKFTQGIRKLISLDFTGFNQNVQNRLTEIEDALENCSHIQLLVAHTGSGISNHAREAIDNFIRDDHGEDRLVDKPIDYDAIRVVQDLQEANAYKKIDTEIWIQKCSSVTDPRATYFGLIPLSELVKLHQKHGKALYAKNIRTFLGQKTDVNVSIRQTLSANPKEFLYLNNGVAALCQDVEQKGSNRLHKGGKKFKVRGFSIINGAQTIASAAQLLEDNSKADISAARVSFTLIKASDSDEFGKSVTRARNHQNPVTLSHFVALDDEQERLRRELAHLDIHYAYKAEASDNKSDPMRIGVDEAAQALALFHPDPRFVIWLKKEPSRLLDMNTEQYKTLFSATLSAIKLANAVQFLRYVQCRMTTEVRAASGQERLTYKHGNHAIGWVLAKRVANECSGARLFDEGKLRDGIGVAFDQLRQTVWAVTGNRINITFKGPLALYRNQTETIPLLDSIIIQHYNLGADPVVAIKKNQQTVGQAYPKDLFEYLIAKAPQIGSLT
ncbi:MAG: AIPR family protein [Smithella sp.]